MEDQMKKLVAVLAGLVLLGLVTVRAEEGKKADEVQLTGKIGCAHCAYDVAKKCAVSFKTADGKIYTLEKASKELMAARNGGGTIKVTGTVTEKEGKLYVNASKAEMEK